MTGDPLEFLLGNKVTKKKKPYKAKQLNQPHNTSNRCSKMQFQNVWVTKKKKPYKAKQLNQPHNKCSKMQFQNVCPWFWKISSTWSLEIVVTTLRTAKILYWLSCFMDSKFPNLTPLTSLRIQLYECAFLQHNIWNLCFVVLQPISDFTHTKTSCSKLFLV